MSITEIKNMHSANYIIFLALFKNVERLMIGGFVTAIGVCVMHYLGMSAIVTDARIEYNAGIVAASILIAVIAASAGYWILFRLLALYPHIELLRLISSFIVAIAVNGMHYTGMAATRFIYVPDYASRISQAHTVSSEAAVGGAIVASMIFLLFVLLMTTADLRAWFYMNSRTVRDADQIIEMLSQMEHPTAAIREALHKYFTMREQGGTRNRRKIPPCQSDNANSPHFAMKKLGSRSYDSTDSRFQSGKVKGSRYKLNSVVVEVEEENILEKASADAEAETGEILV